MTGGVTMASSGIEWVDITFNSCVIILAWLAGKLNITYEEINIYIFCVGWPLLTLYQTLRITYLKRKVSNI